MIICPKCGAKCEDGMKFCTQCAAPLPKKIICKKCGAELEPTWKVCPECGTPVNEQKNNLSNGLSMGDKNVVAGDLIGNKQHYKLSGDATFIENKDESKKVLT